VFLLAACDRDPGVTLYAIECNGKVVSDKCQGTLGDIIGRISWVAFPESQTVTSQSGGKGYVERYDNCVVQSPRTWTCTQTFSTDDSVMTRIMDRGQFRTVYVPGHAVDFGHPAEVVFVSPWRYHWYRLTHPHARAWFEG